MSGAPDMAVASPRWLARARLPATLVRGAAPGPINADGLFSADIQITNGKVASIAPVGTAPADAGTRELAGGMVLPAFVDIHTHLDKGHIWPRAPNPDGTFDAARATVRADREAHWRAADMSRRFEFALMCAQAHGTAAIRTHLDSFPDHAEISWRVFRELRDTWADRIELQAVSLMTLDVIMGEWGERLADLVAESGGVLGGVPLIEEGGAVDFDQAIERLLDLAEARGLDLDLHVDEDADCKAAVLVRIARAVARRGFKGRVLCGHCCSLALESPEEAEKTIAACAEAGIAIVSLPMCNLYLQDRRAGRTPRWRGVTPLREIAEGGVAAMVASDNCRDPFYAYGDHDMVEVLREAVRISHLDHPLGDWPRAITSTPADVMGLGDAGVIARGHPADLVLFRARSWNELLSRPQGDRVVLRAGRVLDARPPDYRMLDDLMGPAQP
jgi:cytosine deaminase